MERERNCRKREGSSSSALRGAPTAAKLVPGPAADAVGGNGGWGMCAGGAEADGGLRGQPIRTGLFGSTRTSSCGLTRTGAIARWRVGAGLLVTMGAAWRACWRARVCVLVLHRPAGGAFSIRRWRRAGH